MFLSVILFNDSFTMIMSITFTTMILIEFLNVVQEVTVLRSTMIVSILISLGIYFGTVYMMPTLF